MAIGPGTSHVTIRGLDMQCCEGTAVTVREASDCLLAGNTIHHTGSDAMLGERGGAQRESSATTSTRSAAPPSCSAAAIAARSRRPATTPTTTTSITPA